MSSLLPRSTLRPCSWCARQRYVGASRISKQLDVDRPAAECLRDALGAIDADGRDDLHRDDQARGEREVDGRSAERFVDLAEGTVARVERDRARDEKLGRAQARRPVPLLAVTTWRALRKLLQEVLRASCKSSISIQLRPSSLAAVRVGSRRR